MRLCRPVSPPESLLVLDKNRRNITLELEIPADNRSFNHIATRVKALAPDSEVESLLIDSLKETDVWLRDSYLLLYLNSNSGFRLCKSSKLVAGEGCRVEAVFNLLPYLYLESLDINLLLVYVTRSEYALFEYRGFSVTEIDRGKSEVPKKIRGGGWLGFEENRFRRHADEHIRVHLGRVQEEIERLMDSHNPDGLVMVCPPEMKKTIEQNLNHNVRQKLLFVLEGINIFDVRKLNELLLYRLKEMREAEIGKLIAGADASGKLITDRASAFEVLNMSNIDKLVVPLKPAEDRAYMCAADGLGFATSERCPACGREMDVSGSADLLLVFLALKKGVEVHVSESTGFAAVKLF